MIRLMQKLSITSIVFTALAGCATNIGAPQTSAEFVSGMKAGGMFRNAEVFAVNRPVRTVVADMTEYANKCISVRTSHGPSYTAKQAATSTTYLPKIATSTNGVTTFSVQEQYNEQPQSGAPQGGMFTFVAEIRSAGNNKTQLDVYYLTSRGNIAKWLKRWSEGDKQTCPSLD